MLYSAIGYIITLFMAFTIIPLLAFLLRMILIMVLSRAYWGITGDKSPASLLKFSIKLAQPIGFLTAIFHGYAALWMGAVLLRGLGVPIDYFLAALLGGSFIWFGVKRLQTPADIKVKNNLKITDKDGEETIILNPDVDSTPEDGAASNSMNNLDGKLKKQLANQTREFMQGNTVIGLMGKLTGVVIGTMSHILPLV
jgi:hypothetical protein